MASVAASRPRAPAAHFPTSVASMMVYWRMEQTACDRRLAVPYVNTDDSKIAFEKLLRSPYFVDKTGLIGALAPRIDTEQSYVCITRPRRFGKTVNARMLACFLSRGLSAEPLFEGLEVSRDGAAMAHLGAHDVIYIDFSRLPQRCEGYGDYLSAITDGVIADLREAFPEASIPEDERDLFAALDTAFAETGARFCFVMDEWDSMFFNELFTEGDRRAFLMFLKQLLKGRPYVEFAYMTGILPIAKHSTGSELNMFDEYSAVDDPLFDRFFGFTEDEVRGLCARHAARACGARVGYEGLARWYDGYITETGRHMFNPRSVALALERDQLKSYWTESGPYDEIYYYVRNDVDAVRDDLVRMVAGEPVEAQMKNYAASAMSLTTRDEIFSAMAVYGFLTYHEGRVSIPNHELMLKFQDVLAKEEMGYVARLARRSREMLAATLRGDAEAMADVIAAAHDQEVPLLRYANEADLAALVNLVYLAARDRYLVRREEPAGRGVADVAFVPADPADAECRPFVVELKAGGTAAGAVAQIRERNYPALFADELTGESRYARRPLAVGIAWDPKTKLHECLVEEL